LREKLDPAYKLRDVQLDAQLMEVTKNTRRKKKA
jgi:hypothetical protein